MSKDINPVEHVRTLCSQNPRAALNYLRNDCCGPVDMTQPNAEKKVRKMVRTMVSDILEAFRNVAIENGARRSNGSGKKRYMKGTPIMGPRSPVMELIYNEVMEARQAALKRYKLSPRTPYNTNNFTPHTGKYDGQYIQPN